MSAKTASLDTIFCAAIEIGSAKDRAAYLAEACGDDLELRRQAEKLVAAHFQAGSFLEGSTSGPPETAEFRLDVVSSGANGPAEPVGSVIGPYKLLEPIGEGGMGTVFMAEQTHPVRRKVALKVIKPGMDTRQVIARFEAERQALALMDHPNIAKVLDAGSTESGRPYFVMELVRGIPITDYCDQAKLSLDGRLELFVLVCQAVQHAHQKGIIHRDIKPSNVLVTLHDGVPVPKVIDFGVAKATGQALTDKTLYTGFAQLVGTPLYMSPEQAEFSGLDIDTRSDIYSLGVLLYELLTGTTPFDAETFRKAAFDQVCRLIREKEPLKPSARLSTLEAGRLSAISTQRQTDHRRLNRSLRGELDWIVMKALEKDRRRRYETASAFAADVGRYRRDETVQACPPSVWYQLRKRARRNRVALVMMGLLIGTTITSLMVATKEIQRRKAAVTARIAAVEVGNLQSRLRQQAEDVAEQSRQRQVRLNVEQGTRLMNEGDLAGSLPSFVEALRLDANDLARAADHRLRLGMLLAHCPKPSRVWFQDQPLSFVMYRPDGRAVAIASRDGTVTVRAVDSGEPIGPTLKHADQVVWLDFSPDGRRLATACWDRSARIWDVAAGREAVPPLAHRQPVGYVEFSPDGRLVVTRARHLVPDDPACRVWDAATGQPVTDWFGTEYGESACFSPDSRSVAFPSGHSLRIVDARTGRPVAPPMPHGHQVKLWRRCFSPDGRRVVTGCLDAMVRVWDTTTGRQTIPGLRHAHYAEGVFSPDGRWVLSKSDDGTARVWDAATGAPRCDPMRHPAGVGGVMFSPDGTRVVTVCEAHARVWDAVTGRLLLPPLWHVGLLNGAVFSPDGRSVLTASEDRTVRLWDLASASPAGPRLPELNALSHARFSPDGRLLVTRGSGGVARVWDARTGSPSGAPLLSPSTWLSAGEFSPDGRSFAALGNSEERRADAWVWDLETRRVAAGPLVHRFDESSANTPTRIVAWSPDSRRLATAAGSNVWGSPVTTIVRVWDARTGRPVTGELPYDAAVFTLDFSPDGRSLLTASGSYHEFGRPGEARILDAATGALRVPAMKTPGACQAARFSPDGKRLITASRFVTSWTEGCDSRIWDAATGRPLTPPMPHELPVSDAFFSPDGRLAVTVSNTLRVWDAATGAPVLPPIRSGPFVTVSFSPDGRRLLAACGAEAIYATNPGFAQVFDVATGWPLTPPLWRERFVQDARFSPDGRRVVTTSWVGGALLWDLKPDDRPIEDLVRTAEVLSATRIDASGAAVPVAPSELREAYEALLRKDPGAFTASREQVLGWNHQQALTCEKALAWDAAVKHLDRLIEDGPRVDVMTVRRGLAHAELGHWQEASRDLDIGKLTPQTGFDVWYRAALVHLGSGDRNGYRAACAGMLQHFGGPDASGQPAGFTAWTCALAPDALQDSGPALALAERLRADQPRDPMIVTTLGALHYRAGRFAKAVERLTEAEQLQPDQRTSPIYGWFLLAMVHHRLGQNDEARHRINQAMTATDKALASHERGAELLPLQRRLTLTLLRTEATALLGMADLPEDVFARPGAP